MTVSTISITINNELRFVRANASILQACEEVSCDVPRFCYHERLSVAGNCRMCLVEVQKSPKPVVSCATPVSKGMVVYTNSPLVKKAREAVLEFLLINHPLDCPICDQGGECDLQDETLNYGSDRGRFYEFKRGVEDKDCGPIVKTIMTRCIHCTRCIRFASEIAGQEVLGVFGRGQEVEIGTYVHSFIKTELSGNLVDLCPVGALTSKPYAFVARSWELGQKETVDFFDAVCSDIAVQTRFLSTPLYDEGKLVVSSGEEVVRVLPRASDFCYEGSWISDKTRYAFDGLKKSYRALSPAVLSVGGFSPITWGAFFVDIAQRQHASYYSASENFAGLRELSQRMAVLIGSLVDIEGVYVFNQYLKRSGFSDIQYGNFGLGACVDFPLFYGLNRTVASFETLGSLLMVGMNVRLEAPLLGVVLRRCQSKKALPYSVIGTPVSLRLKHTHRGVGLRSLMALVENRSVLLVQLCGSIRPSLLVGYESLKISGGFFLQRLVFFLAKKLIVQTKTGQRLGFLHQSVGSLSACELGLVPGVRSPLNSTLILDKGISMLFAFQLSEFRPDKWISPAIYTHIVACSTHKNLGYRYDRLVPVKSMYEKTGFLFNIEGRLKKFQKVVTPFRDVKSVEMFLVVLSSLQSTWRMEEIQLFWSIRDEIPFSKVLGRSPAPFTFNLLWLDTGRQLAMLSLFYPPVINFYLSDSISTHSPTMGECALFLQSENNFLAEV